MKILMISDTHGNQQMIHAMFVRSNDFDLTLHLGDSYVDTNLWIDSDIPLIRIPGTWDSAYLDPLIDNRRIEEWLGWRFFLTHTPDIDSNDLPEDLDPYQMISQQSCDVLCHGHTHEPMIRFDNNVLIVNPGHLKNDIDRGYPASYAQITLNKKDCLIEIINFNTGQSIKCEQIFR